MTDTGIAEDKFRIDKTKDWRLLAADMIDARKFSVGGDTDLNGPEMKAASFLWDQGIFYLGKDGMDEIAKMLRKTAAELKA